MKEFILRDKGTLILNDKVIEMDEGSVKIKITKAAVTDLDILQYNGLIGSFGVVPLRSAVGVISDPQASVLFSRGERVYVNPYLPCNNCYYCKTDRSRFCTHMQIMGETCDGFLTEFKKVNESNLIALPENVTDEQALFIESVATAINIIDCLDITKGDHLVIFGSDITANLLCQLALYYQAVPILVDNNDFNVETAKKCGVYYNISSDSDAQRQITEITGGRMAEKLVYFASSRFSAKHIYSVCGQGARVVYTGYSQSNIATDYRQALSKQLNVSYVSGGFGNIPSAINMLVNKAVSVTGFIGNTAAFSDSEKTFQALAEQDVNTLSMYHTVINL